MDQINIRLAKPADTSAILEIYAPFILNTTTSFEYEVPSVTEFYQRIAKVLETAPWLVCTINDKVVGYAYASEYRSRTAYQWSKEVSVYVHDEFHHRKIATALYTSLFALLKWQGFTNILAGIALPNPASVSFHDQFEFQLIGIYHNIGFKKGSYRDVSWSEKFIGEKDQAPQALKKMSDIVDTPEWMHHLEKGIKLVVK